MNNKERIEKLQKAKRIILKLMGVVLILMGLVYMSVMFINKTFNVNIFTFGLIFIVIGVFMIIQKPVSFLPFFKDKK